MDTDPAPRYLTGTRGEVVRLLRRGPRTAGELAEALGLTANAVRAHLATLERDALVRRVGSRRGAGKPAVLYELGDRAPGLFAKAHEPVLDALLAALADDVDPDDLDAILDHAGTGLGRELRPADGELSDRVEAAADVLRGLGGLVDVDPADGGYELRGHDCPLGRVAVSHPDVCRVVEALLTEVTGADVEERCDPASSTPCAFRVTRPG